MLKKTQIDKSTPKLVEHSWNMYFDINETKTNRMRQNLLQRITRKPDICHGKPTIRGLRYPVETMLDLLASGMNIEEILEDYPDLERDDLLACLEYATQLSRTKTSQKVIQ